jgi:hypothetical protein
MGGVKECQFPQCEHSASDDDGSFALCFEHRRLLLDDPGEFRRLWGALEPQAKRSLPPWTRTRAKRRDR